MALGLSAWHPEDYFTWLLEALPGIVAIVILLATYKRFPLSGLGYILVLLHCLVLFIGAHYTYAKVPVFEWIKEYFDHSRNNYDKLGHFMQGFVPAIIAREILIRKQVLNKTGWMFFICLSICLAISGFYELIEALVSITTGEAGDAFLGTQGFIWDTQTDILLAGIGATTAVLTLSKMHDRSLARLELPG